MNNTFVTLILKMPGAEISCINTLHKFLSKLLSNRLAEMMSDLLSANQSAFTRGRLIADNVLLAKEHLRGFNQKGTARRVCVNLDSAKAFDSASWKAIRLTMETL